MVTLPGGWVDVGDSPSEAIEREEEAVAQADRKAESAPAPALAEPDESGDHLVDVGVGDYVLAIDGRGAAKEHLVPVRQNGPDGVFVEVGSRREHEEGLDLFAMALVRYTDDGDLGHGWMLVENIFDFCRIDVLTTGYEHVLPAIDDVVKTFLIIAGSVA